MDCFADLDRLMAPWKMTSIISTEAHVPKAKQLSMAATARVIWMCACVSYWPYRGVVTCASVLIIGVVHRK